MKKLFLGIFALILSGCANSTPYPEQVLIPTKCDIPARTRPAFDKERIVESLKNLLIYAENLESDLSFCRGEKTQEEAK